MPDDLQYVKLPDGSYGAFPAGMKDEEISAAIQKQSGKVPTGQATGISAQPSTWEKVKTGVGRVAMDPFNLPEEVGSLTRPIESYTQEGRAAHPILSRIGDVTRGAKQYAGMVAALSPLIPEGEAVNALRAAGNAPEAAGQAQAVSKLPQLRPRPIVPRPAPAAESIPTVEATPVEPVRPASSSRYDLGEIGPVNRPPIAEPPAAPSPLRPVRPQTLSSPKIQDRVTMAQSELRPIPAGASEATAKFHELFGPEHQEAADLAEWETGSPEGTPGLKTIKPLERTEPMQEKPLAERSLGQQQVTPKLEDVIDRAVGKRPLEPNVPLKDQLTIRRPVEAGEEVDPLKIKYPDAKVRQLVRANGERLFEAAKGDPELLKQLHDLTRVDLREALINAGEDMEQKTVSDSKFAGEGSISRKQAFEKLLDKGHSPEKILDLAKPKESL
jgi:hypothetical protein